MNWGFSSTRLLVNRICLLCRENAVDYVTHSQPDYNRSKHIAAVATTYYYVKKILLYFLQKSKYYVLGFSASNIPQKDS